MNCACEWISVIVQCCVVTEHDGLKQGKTVIEQYIHVMTCILFENLSFIKRVLERLRIFLKLEHVLFARVRWNDAHRCFCRIGGGLECSALGEAVVLFEMKPKLQLLVLGSLNGVGELAVLLRAQDSEGPA